MTTPEQKIQMFVYEWRFKLTNAIDTDEHGWNRWNTEAKVREEFISHSVKNSEAAMMAIEKLTETILNKAYCNCQQCIADGWDVKPCWACKALDEVANLLGKGDG